MLLISICETRQIGITTQKKGEMVCAVAVLGLIFSVVVRWSEAVPSGCEDWKLSTNPKHEVCCTRCKPGNRLVKLCGVEPEDLCTPCDIGTYITNTDYRCHRCTQCTGIQFTVKSCTASRDAICGCTSGFRCGDNECSFCVTECKKGEEPTSDRLCRACPEGTFSDEIHSYCKEWTKCCNEGFILINGSNSSDSICTPLDNGKKRKENRKVEVNTPYSHHTLSVKRNQEEQTNSLPLLIAAVMGGLAVLCVIVFVAVTITKVKLNETKKFGIPEQDATESSGIVVEEEDDCSFCHPQQEEGGSSDSIHPYKSDSKLLV